jgi:hypothetical protein
VAAPRAVPARTGAAVSVGEEVGGDRGDARRKCGEIVEKSWLAYGPEGGIGGRDSRPARASCASRSVR